MIKRAWFVISLAWSGFWLFVLGTSSDHFSSLHDLGIQLFVFFPWLLGPLAWLALKFIILGGITTPKNRRYPH